MNIMEEEKACIGQRVIPSNEPIEFDENVCIGCNKCIEACMNDVFLPHPEKGKPPAVMHPDECWYCGCCVMECPLLDKEAIKVKWPIKTQLRWKRKETGEHCRVGMADPPPPHLTPPIGGWKAR